LGNTRISRLLSTTENSGNNTIPTPAPAADICAIMLLDLKLREWLTPVLGGALQVRRASWPYSRHHPIVLDRPEHMSVHPAFPRRR
jgi:hypothetical protein